jgi:hypothetical protein
MNLITTLNVNGQSTDNMQEIETQIYQHFQNIFGRGSQTWGKLNASNWTPSEKVTEEENITLTVPFSEEEVLSAITSMSADSAPGPDGIPIFSTLNFGILLKKIS